MFTIEEVRQAYLDCRKNKRNKPSAVKFEMMQGEEIPRLTHELNNGSYQIGVSTAFVITWPKFREVWAADFRDRIVHHAIVNRIQHQFQKQFIYDSYACIKGRGSLFGASRVDKHMRQASENYTKKAHYLQADIANFFVSIDKAVLCDLILPRIADKRTREITSQIIWHDPTTNHIKNSPHSLFQQVPKHKSLFNCDKGKGLPIGNLSSQFFANVYMNVIDQLAKRELGIKWYGRYVDDIVLIGHCPAELNKAFKEIQAVAEEKLKIKFHPNKTNRNIVSNGMDFCGYIIMPNRAYVRKRTVSAMRKIGFSELRYTDPIKWASSMNSYLGICQHANSFNARKRLAIETGARFSPKLTKVIVNRRSTALKAA